MITNFTVNFLTVNCLTILRAAETVTAKIEKKLLSCFFLFFTSSPQKQTPSKMSQHYRVYTSKISLQKPRLQKPRLQKPRWQKPSLDCKSLDYKSLDYKSLDYKRDLQTNMHDLTANKPIKTRFLRKIQRRNMNTK